MKPYLLHQLLDAATQADGDAVAVASAERTLTYGELDVRSNQIANLLAQAGVGTGDRVALYLEKSVESVAGIYGILKAGAAYVPLDPHAPTSRLGYILDDCAIRSVLTSAAQAPSWAELIEHGAELATIVVLDADTGEFSELAGTRTFASDDLDAVDPARPPTSPIDLDLAYVLYTSGSTGVPKGVMLSHRNAMAFVDWAVDEFAVNADDVLSSHAPLHFDLSIFDLYAAASARARLVLVPSTTSVFPVEVKRFIESNNITIWYSVPSILSLLTTRGRLKAGALPSLRTLLFAGEVFPTKYLRQLMGLLPHVRFANLYGPTETNVCTWFEVPVLPEDMTEPISIGKPIANVETYAMTDEGRRAGVGESGELYVRGATVMQGYWGDAERTARALVTDAATGGYPDPAYRTGDLVELQPDGNYRFLGRRDAQIKSRGYRIELGDIEAALYAHPAVEECAAIAVPDELVTNRIKAFVALRDTIECSELLHFCSGRIPKYMVPESITVREVLPKTSTGKIDRQALTRVATESMETT